MTLGFTIFILIEMVNSIGRAGVVAGKQCCGAISRMVPGAARGAAWCLLACNSMCAGGSPDSAFSVLNLNGYSCFFELCKRVLRVGTIAAKGMSLSLPTPRIQGGVGHTDRFFVLQSNGGFCRPLSGVGKEA